MRPFNFVMGAGGYRFKNCWTFEVILIVQLNKFTFSADTREQRSEFFS